MKNTKRVIFLLVTALLFSLKGQSQNYHTGIGLRLGSTSSGITVKHFLNSDGALEGILGFSHRSFLITGLYEKHNSFPNAPGLQWFFGGGAHVGFYRYGYDYYYYYHHPEPEGAYVINGVVY